MKTLKIIVFLSLVSFLAVTCVYFLTKVPDKKSNEVVFWSLQMGTFESYMNPIIEEFEATHPNIKIKWIDVPYSEGEKRTLASILSSVPPDLVNLTPDFSSILAQKQALQYIDCVKLDGYNEQIKQSLMIDGKCYAVPFYATSALTFYNKEILKQSGITILPETFDDLTLIAKKIHNNSGAFVTMPTLTENDTLWKILNKYNIKNSGDLLSEKAIKIFDDYKYLYENNFVPKESITQNHQEALEKYMSGQLAFIQSGANFLNIVKENSPKVFAQTDVSFQLTGDTNKYDVSIMNLVIPARAKNKEAALEFALFLTNKKNQLKLAKLTTILPTNKAALADVYFTDYNQDVISKARFISASQLNNLQSVVKFKNNHKEILALLNSTIQQVLLGQGNTKDLLQKLSENMKKLEK